MQPYQQTSWEVKWLVCALAVFVPFEIAAKLFGMLTGVQVCSKSIWLWVQASGHEAMERLNAQLEALAGGDSPEEEEMEAGIEVLPLLIGADGVMAPFRPKDGMPDGKTVWREVKVGVLARLGQRITQKGKKVTELKQRRLVAVLGDIDALSSRLWLETIQQGILSAPKVVWLSDGAHGASGGSLMNALPSMPRVFWTSIMLLRICGKGAKPGWTGEPSKRGRGSPRLDDNCAEAKSTKCFKTLRQLWHWRACRRRPIKP